MNVASKSSHESTKLHRWDHSKDLWVQQSAIQRTITISQEERGVVIADSNAPPSSGVLKLVHGQRVQDLLANENDGALGDRFQMGVPVHGTAAGQHHPLASVFFGLPLAGGSLSGGGLCAFVTGRAAIHGFIAIAAGAAAIFAVRG